LDNWESLLAKALACLESARTQGLTINQWTFGGGTALMCHFDHRFSRDIDIFVPDAAYLPYLSPRLNDAIASRTDDYDEAAHYVKLRFAEGEIDFIVASTLTIPGFVEQKLAGQSVLLETPVEIAIKKAHYRAENLKPRDIFDLAVVLTECAEPLGAAASVLADRRHVLLHRLSTLDQAYYRQALDELNVKPAWDFIKPTAWDLVTDFVKSIPAPPPPNS
jgi:hypothetical protein